MEHGIYISARVQTYFKYNEELERMFLCAKYACLFKTIFKILSFSLSLKTCSKFIDSFSK